MHARSTSPRSRDIWAARMRRFGSATSTAPARASSATTSRPRSGIAAPPSRGHAAVAGRPRKPLPAGPGSGARSGRRGRLVPARRRSGSGRGAGAARACCSPRAAASSATTRRRCATCSLAVEQGRPDAMLTLGFIYSSGRGVEVDEKVGPRVGSQGGGRRIAGGAGRARAALRGGQGRREGRRRSGALVPQGGGPGRRRPRRIRSASPT